MILHVPLLLLALLLLWLPRRWLRRGAVFFRRRRRSLDPWDVRESGDPRINFRTEFAKFRNYVEFFRGAVGSLVLVGGSGLPAALAAGAEAPRASAQAVLALQAAVLLIGLLVQTLRWEKRHLTFFPPIFYLAGVMLGWGDPRSAIFAFALIWAINPALPNARGFLIVYAFLLLLFGWLFPGRGLLTVAFGCFLVFLPVLLSLLARRPLALLTRKASRGGVRT